MNIWLVDFQNEVVCQLLVSVLQKGCDRRRFFSHARLQSFEGYFFMLFLLIFDFLQDSSYIELHTPDKTDLQHKCSHEVVKHICSLPLQVYSFIFVKGLQNSVMSHRQLHHSINLRLELVFMQLFKRAYILEFFSIFFLVIISYRSYLGVQLDLMSYDLQLCLSVLNAFL